MTTQQTLLTTSQAARYLGYSDGSLKVSRLSGQLSGVDAPKHLSIGTRTIRYKKSDLDNWIIAQSEEG